jgi:hypothetical protein
MYNMQPQQQQQQLPFPINQVDQGTFSPNLPFSNDKVPQLQLRPWQQQNQQLVLEAIGRFRGELQAAVNRTNMHTFAYNVMANGNFNNPQWTEWCGYVANLLEFMLVMQPQANNPQIAPTKAAQTCKNFYLGQMAVAFPQLQQFLNPQQMAEIQQYQMKFGNFQVDWRTYASGAMQQQPQYMQPPQYGQSQQYQQQPMMNTMGSYQMQPQQPQAMMNQLTVNTQAAVQPMQLNHLQQQMAPAGNMGDTYDVPQAEMAKPIQPVEQYGEPSNPLYGDQPAMQQQFQQQPVQQTDLPVPMSVKDVVMDPNYFVPMGVVINVLRPFDVIYSPGGVETRPAHLAAALGWVRTGGSNDPYEQSCDPTMYLRMYTRWPDGTVKESFVKWEDHQMLEYMRHEIDESLRAAAYRPDGEIRVTAVPISNGVNGMKPLEEVMKLDLTDELTPVELPVELQGSTDMENEIEARQYIQENMALMEDDIIPCHEYKSSRTHLLDITPEVFEELREKTRLNDIMMFAKDLKQMTLDGKLPTRVFRFLNDRMTTGVNLFIKDALSIENLDIDSFTDDMGALIDVLLGRYGQPTVDKFKAGTSLMFGKNLNLQFAETSNSATAVAVVDAYINFQLGWTQAQLTDSALKISKEPQLVSSLTHQVFIDVLKSIFKRHTKEELLKRRIRLITADGVYLEVFRGFIMDTAMLIKQV